MDASWADPRSTKSSFWNVIFTYCTQQRTISLSDCDTQWKVNFLQRPANTSSVAGLRRSTKALPKAKTCTKKMIMVTLWWSAADLIHFSFLNPGKTVLSQKYAQQVNELPWKLQRLQPAFVNRKDPILLHDKAQLHVTQPTLQNDNFFFRSAHETSTYWAF